MNCVQHNSTTEGTDMSLQQLSERTYIRPEDVLHTLKKLGLVSWVKGCNVINATRSLLLKIQQVRLTEVILCARIGLLGAHRASGLRPAAATTRPVLYCAVSNRLATAPRPYPTPKHTGHTPSRAR